MASTKKNLGGTTNMHREHDALLIDSNVKSKRSQKKAKCSSKIWMAVICMTIFVAICAALVVLVLASDSSSDDDQSNLIWSPPSPCDPLVSSRCYLPWPNDYWLSKSAGYKPNKLSFTNETLPKDINGATINPSSWNNMDGFSPLPCIMTYFGDNTNVSLDNSNVARLWNINISLDDNAPIIILSADKLQRLPYWVELDYSSDINGGNDTIISNNSNYPRVLMIWPIERLEPGERYIIAIRNLRDDNNEIIDATPGFIYYRDEIYPNISDIEDRRLYFNTQIFDKLSAANIDISELQIAWDFTIQSHDAMTKAMINMRDDAFARVSTDNIPDVGYRITSIIDDPEYDPDNPDNNTARQINGEMQVPWYLNEREVGVRFSTILTKNH